MTTAATKTSETFWKKYDPEIPSAGSVTDMGIIRDVKIDEEVEIIISLPIPGALP